MGNGTGMREGLYGAVVRMLLVLVVAAGLSAAPACCAEEAARPRRSIEGSFSKLAAPGDPLTVTLPADSFPRGSVVTLQPTDDCQWSFKEQKLQVTGEPLNFMVEGPEKLELVDGAFRPPLDVAFTVEGQGRPADGGVIRVGLTARQVEVITAKPKIADVPFSAQRIAVDGDLSDWRAIPPLELPYRERKSDCARFCWRAEGLYGAFAVPDDRIEIPEKPSQTFQADGLELWVETDFARSLDTSRNRYASKFAFNPDPEAGPGKARSGVIFGAFEGKPSKVEAAWRPTDDGYDLEFLLPAEMLAPARMKAGTAMGFHYVLFNEADHAEDTIRYIRGFYRKPYLWAAIRLAAGAEERAEGAAPQAAADTIFPGRDWVQATPESQGVDSKKLEEAMAIVAEIAEDYRDGTRHAGNTQAIVIRNGRMIWKGGDIDDFHRVYSCGKSFMSSVFGLLVDDGKCTPDTPAAHFLPALKEHYPKVTLGQFASLTSGYDVPWRKSPFEIRPPIHPPGRAFHYSSSADQLAHVLTRIAREPLKDLFKRRIADPIGIPPGKWDWARATEIDGLVVYGGAGHVSITAREFARFGHLYLNKGRWGGKQILSARWVEMSTKPQVAPTVPPHEEKGWYIHLPGRYGYNWWVNGVDAKGERWWRSAPPRTFAAQGNRNNYCFVLPEWNMVFVRMGNGKAIDSRLYERVFAKLKEALIQEP